jgi:hypothetical protein
VVYGRLGGRAARLRQAVELVLEYRVHALEVVGARPQTAPGGRFHALGRVSLRQPQNPQASPIALLRVAFGRQDRFHQLPRRRADLLAVFH